MEASPSGGLAGPTNPEPPATIETSAGGDSGPSWLKQDPSSPSASESMTTTPGLENAPPPWQAHSEGAEPTPQVNSTTAPAEQEEQHGGFPVIIFVILVVAIIVAIGIFLFANNAIPGT